MEMENVLARVRCYGTSMLMPVHLSTYIIFLQLCRSDNRVRFLRRKNIFVLRGVSLEVVGGEDATGGALLCCVLCLF